MSEFIGSRISLFSKSDIRYIGTLHQIDSESSTVALENVRSFGTEGRSGDPAKEVPGSDNIYEYIVFKGSDVKDLTILGSAKENQPPQVPNDPAIVGSGSRPPQMQTQMRPQELPRPQGEDQQQGIHAQGQPSQQPFMPVPYYYPPYSGQQRFDSQGMPPPPQGTGIPNVPFGPPSWMYPTPGQGFPDQPRPFPNQNMPFVPLGPLQQPLHSSPQPTPIGQVPNMEQKSVSSAQQSRSSSTVPRTRSTGPTPPKSTTPAAKAPTPPVESKPNAAAALAPPAPVATQAGPMSKPVNAPITKPFGQIVPAVPNMYSANLKGPSPGSGPGETSANMVNPFQANKSQPSQAAATAALQDVTQAATAAMAAAMAKLSPAAGSKQPQQQQQQQTTNGNVDILTRKMNEMKTGGGGGNTKPQRHEGQGHNHGQGTGGYRGGRGRGGHQHTRKIEVPTTDYDFETANAKFNKQDLVKEAIATGDSLNPPDEHQLSTNGTGPSSSIENDNNSSSKTTTEKITIPVSTYNKATSFFDNISSDAKERDSSNSNRPGREWRGEEQKRNLETFGQGSVDTGYHHYHHHHRGGYRGRGRGRGGYGGNSGNYRGGRGGGHRIGGGNRGSLNAGGNSGGTTRGGHHHRSGNTGTGTGGQGVQPQTTGVVGVATTTTTLAATT